MQTNHEGGGRAFYSFCSLFSQYFICEPFIVSVYSYYPFIFLIIPYTSTLVLFNLFILYNLKSDILVPSCLFILISLYPCIRVPLKPWILVFILVSLYPRIISCILIPQYFYPCIHVSQYPSILIFQYSYILVSLYSSILKSLYLYILVSLYPSIFKSLQYPYILVSLYPSIHISLYPYILVS